MMAVFVSLMAIVCANTVGIAGPAMNNIEIPSTSHVLFIVPCLSLNWVLNLLNILLSEVFARSSIRDITDSRRKGVRQV